MPSSLNTAVRLSAILPVFLCLVDAVPVHSSMGELVETSGDEVQDVNIRPSVTAEQRWHLMARELYNDVKTLRDEQFNRDFSQTENITSFHRVSTPLLKSICLSTNFSTEKCLERIYSVLTWYKEHFSYIERENLTLTLTNDVKHGTKRLLEAISRQWTDTQVEKISSSPLHAKSAWTRKKTAHSILFNFTTVLKETCRALNYVSTRKTEHNQQAKDRKKTIEWLSDKN